MIITTKLGTEMMERGRANQAGVSERKKCYSEVETMAN